MHARRAILPIVLFVAYAALQRAPDPSLRARIADEMPEADHALAVADAPKTLDELRRRIAAVLAREHVPGAALALVDRDGTIWSGGIGVRDRATQAPMEGDTVFRVGSLSKSIIALAVMRLVDEGKLDVDRPLREILPDVAIENPWEAVAPVTLAQCMEHTAGLDDVRFNEVFTDDEQLSARDAIAINPRSKHIRWQPGTRNAYSNVGYTLAARAVEVASGEPFDVYVRREILTPLGIADADFRRTSVLSPRLASGYMDGDHVARFIPFAHRPAGALLASVSDLARLVHFWIARGEGYPPIVSAAGLARIERSGTLPYAHLDSDYGFANYGDVAHPVISRGHDGGMPGFHSSYRYFPSLGVGYVMLLNSNYTFRGYFEIRSLLFSYLTGGRTFAQPPIVASTDHPAEFYALAAPRNAAFGFMDVAKEGWHVAERGNRVRVVENGHSYFLVPTADGGYRATWECGSSHRFATNGEGTPVLVQSYTYGEATSELAAQLRYGGLAITMVLLHVAPLFAVGVLALAALRRRRVLPASLILWPALAGLCCFAFPQVLQMSFLSGVIGTVHPLTIAFFAITIMFAVASTMTLVSAIRWARRPDRPWWTVRAFPTVCGVAFFALTLWLAAHDWIGLRTWAW